MSKVYIEIKAKVLVHTDDDVDNDDVNEIIEQVACGLEEIRVPNAGLDVLDASVYETDVK